MKNQDNPLAFGKKNYILMLVGILIIALGYVLMSLDPQPHGYGFLGLTLGPIVLLIGFALEFFAILTKDKSAEEDQEKSS